MFSISSNTSFHFSSPFLSESTDSFHYGIVFVSLFIFNILLDCTSIRFCYFIFFVLHFLSDKSNRAQLLFDILLYVFDNLIMKTYKSKYTQFLIYYFLSLCSGSFLHFHLSSVSLYHFISSLLFVCLFPHCQNFCLQSE